MGRDRDGKGREIWRSGQEGMARTVKRAKTASWSLSAQGAGGSACHDATDGRRGRGGASKKSRWGRRRCACTSAMASGRLLTRTKEMSASGWDRVRGR